MTRTKTKSDVVFGRERKFTLWEGKFGRMIIVTLHGVDGWKEPDVYHEEHSMWDNVLKRFNEL